MIVTALIVIVMAGWTLSVGLRSGSVDVPWLLYLRGRRLDQPFRFWLAISLSVILLCLGVWTLFDEVLS